MSAVLLVIVGAAVGAPAGYAVRALVGGAVASELAAIRERMMEIEVLLGLLRPAINALHRLTTGGDGHHSATGTGNYPAVRDP